MNKALGDAKQALHQHLYVKPSEEKMEQLKNENDLKNSLFRRFFSEIKDQLSNEAVGRVFITGVAPIALNDFTSGFNIAKHITHDERFAEMCGLTHENVRNGLNWLTEEEIEQHLNTMTEYYDGLMFHPDQKNRLFNTTLAIYYMDYLAQHGKAPNGRKLIDSNIQPSESVFNILSNTPLCLQIVTKLLSSNKNEIYSAEEIIDVIATKNMMNLIVKDELFVMSLMYYLGALTQDKLPENVKTGTVFRIPNKVIRKEYIDTLSQRFQINKASAQKIQLAITALLREKDIGPICQFAEEHFQTLMGNAVKFQNEKDLQALFVYGFYFYGKTVQGEQEFMFTDNEGKGRYADFLFQPDDAVHIEFKNIKTSSLIVEGETFDEWKNSVSWDIGYSLNDRLQEMSDEQIMELPVRETASNPKYYIFAKDSNGNYLKKDLKNVYDVWVNLLKQTKMNKNGIQKNLAKTITSFAVLRVGLRKLFYQKVE